MIETRPELGRNTGENEMAKANKDGWIRHRGGKKPVADNEFVQIRLRDGTIQGKPMKAGFYFWEHESDSSDIMSYRIHTPQQQETEPMTAEQIRAQYMENLSSIAMLHTKNAALVDDLRKMGFDFYDAQKEPQEDMSDPKNWRVGDKLIMQNAWFSEAARLEGCEVTINKVYSRDGVFYLVIEELLQKYKHHVGPSDAFKFHSRPTK